MSINIGESWTNQFIDKIFLRKSFCEDLSAKIFLRRSFCKFFSKTSFCDNLSVKILKIYLINFNQYRPSKKIIWNFTASISAKLLPKFICQYLNLQKPFCENLFLRNWNFTSSPSTKIFLQKMFEILPRQFL